MSNYSFAPYNFIPFSESVKTPVEYSTREDLPAHNTFSDEMLSGRIEYNITALTDIIVGGADSDRSLKKFFKDGQGRYAIPGSTMRGFIRSHAELLSFSYPDMIDDAMYLYRKFADSSKKLRDEYTSRMKADKESEYGIPNGVKAGYIYCRREKGGTHYYIRPVKEFGTLGTTFFKVHENTLRKANVLSPKHCMYTRELPSFKPKSSKTALDEYRKKYIPLIKKMKNNNYSAYRGRVVKFSYNEGHIADVNNDNAPYSAMVLNSSYIDGKTHHYFVSAEMETSVSPIPIEDDYIEAYRNDLARNSIQNKKLKEKNKPGFSFYELDDKEISEKGKLFFYKIDEKGRLLGFGPTPYFRILYKNSVSKGIPYSVDSGYDFVKSMFGFTDKSESYKSRISFQNAVITKEAGSYTKKMMVSGSPRGTAVQMYLDQSDKRKENLASYNDESFRLRGYKVYWKRSKPMGYVSEKDNMNTTYEIIKAGSVFSGSIYYNNLTKEELGLLLLSIQYKNPETTKHDETYLIGGAKAYGFGKIRIDDIELYSDDVRKSLLSLNATDEKKSADDIDNYKKYYKDTLKREYDIDLDSTDTVKVYKSYGMSDQADQYLSGYETGYMSVKDRNKDLPGYPDRYPLATAEIIMQESNIRN